ncbi:MAG: TrkA family potassium uptake protein [Eubacteriales bacterium]|nr:TrkA family potassium uptake protein [Eubacteriales bacterium]
MTKKSYLIIGMGRFGSSVALTLSTLGHEVFVVDRNEEHISDVADRVTSAMVADASEERVLRQLGVSNYDAVVVAVGDNILASVLISVQCKEMGASYLVSKAYDDLHAQLLKKMGVDNIVMPERESGARLAHSLTNRNIFDFIQLSGKYAMSQVRVPDTWIGKSLGELNVRARHGISIIAVQRGDSVSVSVGAAFVLQAEDVLILICSPEELGRLEKL